MQAPKVIAVCNHKGGVGKTTTVASLSAALSNKGYKVLAVDLDPQSNLTYSLSPDSYEGKATVSDALFKGAPMPTYSVAPGIDLAPADFLLTTADKTLRAKDTLRKALLPLYGKYDYILIDTAPGIGILTLNALSAATTGVIVTLTAEALPTQGMQNLEDVVEAEGAKIVGYLITRYQRRQLTAGVVAALSSRLGDRLFSTRIGENIALAEAPFSRSDIFRYNPKSKGAKDYAAFAEELLSKI
jgi:chromosome partitioning protein